MSPIVLRYAAVFHDAQRLIRRLKPLGVWNYLLIYLGFWLSRLSGKVFVFGKPFAISAEVSAVCNLRCPECIVGLGETRRDRQRMDSNVFEQLLADRQKHSFYVNLYFQGEPFLNPDLPRLISAASGLGYYTSVSTNGHFLDEENCREVVRAGLDRLIVSLDGLDQDTYAFYRRGGNFQKVADGIASLARVRREMGATNPLLVVQFLVNRRNEGQLNELKTFARSQGADVVELKSMQVYGEAGASAFLPENKRFNRYKSRKVIKAPEKKKGPCFRVWSHAVYTSDGLLVPCCFDKAPAYPMGNKTGEDPWFSPAMNAFRRRVMHHRTEISICSNCTQ